jgi:photosystem II stability/assembly factor-like uncharacterized protein
MGTLSMACNGLVYFGSYRLETRFIHSKFESIQRGSFLSAVLYLWAELVHRLSRQNAQRAGWRSVHPLECAKIFIIISDRTMRTFRFISLIILSFFISCKEPTSPSTDSFQWFLQREKQDDITYYSIYFSNETNGWIVGYSGIIKHSSDGGITWYSQQSGVSSNLWGVCFVNSQNGWVCGAGNTVLRTLDGGGSWQNISPADTSGPIYVSIKFIDENVGWMSSNSGEILKSTNGGISWELNKKCNLTARLAVFNANSVYALVPGVIIEKLYKTFDGGAIWDSVQFSIPKNYRESGMFFANANCGWITTENGTGGTIINDYPVVMTEDAGITWSSSDLLKDGGVTCVYFVTDKIGWVAGFNNIYKTIDGGKHWNLEFSTNNGELHAKDIHFCNASCGWIINYSGQIYKYKTSSH